jgi:hypothetical protein
MAAACRRGWGCGRVARAEGGCGRCARADGVRRLCSRGWDSAALLARMGLRPARSRGWGSAALLARMRWRRLARADGVAVGPPANGVAAVCLRRWGCGRSARADEVAVACPRGPARAGPGGEPGPRTKPGVQQTRSRGEARRLDEGKRNPAPRGDRVCSCCRIYQPTGRESAPTRSGNCADRNWSAVSVPHQ